MGYVDMRRLSKLKAAPAHEAASGELQQRAPHETSTPSSTTPSDNRPMSSSESARPVWHKDNYGFWLLACVLISVVFSVVYRAVG